MYPKKIGAYAFLIHHHITITKAQCTISSSVKSPPNIALLPRRTTRTMSTNREETSTPHHHQYHHHLSPWVIIHHHPPWWAQHSTGSEFHFSQQKKSKQGHFFSLSLSPIFLLKYSGFRLIQPRLIQPAALTSNFSWPRICMKCKTPDIIAKLGFMQPLLVGIYYIKDYYM